jgi:hypothetical protein
VLFAGAGATAAGIFWMTHEGAAANGVPRPLEDDGGTIAILLHTERNVTDQELDDVRRLLVAFEDAATWCQQMAEMSRDTISALQQRRLPSPEELTRQSDWMVEMLRYLDADRLAVNRIRARVGLAPAS